MTMANAAQPSQSHIESDNYNQNNNQDFDYDDDFVDESDIFNQNNNNNNDDDTNDGDDDYDDEGMNFNSNNGNELADAKAGVPTICVYGENGVAGPIELNNGNADMLDPGSNNEFNVNMFGALIAVYDCCLYNLGGIVVRSLATVAMGSGFKPLIARAHLDMFLVPLHIAGLVHWHRVGSSALSTRVLLQG